GKPIGILADLQGPKIRVAKVPGGGMEIKAGQEVWMEFEPQSLTKDGRAVIPVGYKEFVNDVAPGNTVLLDDGLMELRARDREGTALLCEVVIGGLLKDNKGINVPEASFSAPAITDKDYSDVLFCLEQGVDFIAMSFVRTPQEVRHLKSFVESRGKKCKLIAKIEKRDALVNLEAIIDAADGILVARGDLAVEVGNEKVPVWQKRMVRKCNLRGKTSIIATQMLMSMVDNPRPSRAEASDVANAIVEGADAVMLSNETAVGKYPMEAVGMMVRIIEQMEEQPYDQPILWNEWELPPEGQMAVGLLQSAVRLGAILHTKVIAVLTESGQSALLISKCRPWTQVVALTSSMETYHQLSLKWGVEAVFLPEQGEMTQTAVFDAVGHKLRALKLCSTGDKIVITAGLPRLAHGSTNTIKIHQV
ncbi:pyruvate kinase, partial [bacterium]|nr:pyruvate kinase [bacterium]